MHFTKKYLKQYCLLASTLVCGMTALAQPVAAPAPYTAGTPVNGVSTINYIRTFDATAPEQNATTLMGRWVSDVKTTTQYMDGLGRPIQTVARQASLETSTGALADIIAPTVYDEFGREQYKYLPTVANNTGGNTSITDGNFKLNPFQQQAAFYADPNGVLKNQGETYFYNKTNFEASPLNRVQEAFAAGNSWVGTYNLATENDRRSTKIKYWINTLTDDVKNWVVTDVTGSFGTYALSNTMPTYNPGELTKMVTVDERGNQVIEFKDKEGKVILKKVQISNVAGIADDGMGRGYNGWLCTYYIYDYLNQLRCVIQPKGVELIQPTWVLNDATILAEQCFRYEYDQRKRMIRKKVPGAGEVFMVYDTRDRLIMTQDANIRVLPTGAVWLITKYDALNRPTETGMWKDLAATPFNIHLTNANNSNNNSYPITTSNYEQLSITNYDDYAGLPSGLPAELTATYNSSYNDNFAATDNAIWPYPQMPIQSNATRGMVTWSQTKILGSSPAQFITAIIIYDDKARVIQTKATNITNGVDIVTTQYTWAGQPLVAVQRQQKQGTNANEHIIVSKMTYDDLGRLLATKKAINSNVNGVAVTKPEQEIVRNQYDKLGQLKNKKLAPAYNNNAGLETLNYDYNIRGWMLGMNRDYAKDNNNTNYFGYDLGYDKTNNNIIGNQTYTAAQYNGNIAGTVWKSKGDGEKRKYDFVYDNANRLLAANFNQYTGGAFNTSANVDFSTKMGNGLDYATAYDANGNIQGMTQKGLKINVSTDIDQLTYSYILNTNKLAKVTDAIVAVDNGKLGDFKDGANGTTNDYTYDVNGNLNLDNNKAISSITYNYLNLPSIISIPSKGTITYTYDAAGNKMKKVTAENTTNIVYNGNTYASTITTTTDYIAGYVYESKEYSDATVNTALAYTGTLQFLGHEEGRIRFKPQDNTTTPQIPASFNYDYLVKDHLGNTRMVLTEEVQQDKYPVASLEDAKIATEQKYYQINTAQIVNTQTTTVPGLPTYNNDNGIGNNPTDAAFSATNSTKLYKLNGSSPTTKTGLGITLKVMAGDKIDVFGRSYYFANNPTPTNNNISTIPVLDILAGFLGSPLAAATTAVHGEVTATTLNNPTGITGINNLFTQQNNQNNTASSKPKAFINVIFFDEQFKAVDFKTSIVGNNQEQKQHFSELQNLAANKSGFVYIYCSNETSVDVLFDNVQVVQTRSPIMEETHYYPFGLTMSGISSKAAGSLENKKKWNVGSELNTDLDINLYETFYRSLDPQIGRFWQVDPKPSEYESPFVSMGNNPISNVDPKGDYFFGLFGSTSEQRKAARAVAAETGGEIHNITKKSISVSYIATDKSGTAVVGSTGFYEHGFPTVLGKQAYNEFLNQRATRLYGKPASGRVEMVDDPITMLGPGLVRGLMTKILAATTIKSASLEIVEEGAEYASKLPVGRSGNVLQELTPGMTRNTATTINGTKFTGHALDQMQNRGIISPTAVLDVINNPVTKMAGNTPGTTVFIKENVKVIANQTGDVISVIWQ